MKCNNCGRIEAHPPCECGGRFYQEKGVGASEPVSITSLHVEILDLLRRVGSVDSKHAAPKQFIAQRLNDGSPRISGNSVSGRLSELRGMRYVDCRPEVEDRFDPKTMQKVKVAKFYWWVTDKGMELLKEKVEAK